ncbi:hypothetical protein FJT64_005551 [Amphibalanus amphitrite]|uniref:C2H2-type domain-containing protein n=1 Tax=Amphibalanus amphitrite TaxID=1232801 RepID=A0A6A4W4W2_AMPAM|nr:hypothetical protein FJT64_005551 [Amphibalanus amphitrite]
MRSCPPEDDEDWGLCSDLDDSEEEVGLRQAGGPLRCWQRAGFKRLTIDERRPPAVLPARYSVSACCAVCGRRPGAGHPLAPLFDDTSFVSMADVVKDVVGLEFSVSTNPHENVMCGDCRGHLLALHTMRGWLAALQRQFVRMVVCTNSGRRSAKILVPKAYRGVDFFSREAPFLELLESSGRTSASDLHQPPSSLHRAALTQPPEPPQSAPAAPSTPPRPAATGADATDPAGLLDPFEEYSISDLLVLRSPLAARPPAAPEGPPPAKLKKIAPKIDRRDLPPQPPPIVLNSTSLESLRKHFSTTHVRAAAVACGRCEQLFSNLEAVQHHIRRKHPLTGPRPLVTPLPGDRPCLYYDPAADLL